MKVKESKHIKHLHRQNHFIIYKTKTTLGCFKYPSYISLDFEGHSLV